MRRFLSAASFLTALSATAAAHAVGAFAARPDATSVAARADVAIAVTPGHVTTWARTRFVGAADRVVWLLPVPPGAVVDVASPAWLDALEDATAPRILPPAKQPQGASCNLPTPVVESDGDAGAPASLASYAVLDDLSSLAATLGAWGFAPHSLDAAGKVALLEGQRLLVLELDGAEGVTPTVRVHGGAADFPRLLADGPAATPFTLWMLGDGRGFVPGGTERLVAPASIAWTSPTSTSYAAARSALLTDASASVMEMTGWAAGASTNLPGSGAIPGLVDAFAWRSASTKTSPTDLAVQASAALLTPTLPSPCPRGDLTPAPACASSPSPLDAPALAVLDELRFAFAGVPHDRWLTRLSAITDAGTTCRAMGSSFAPGSALAPSMTAGQWGPLCTTPTPPPPAAQPGTGNGNGGVAPDDPTADDQGTLPPGDAPSAVVDANIDTSGCSCSSDSGGDGSSDGGGCSKDSSSSSDSSGCSSGSSGSSEGCSSGSGSGSGCSGGSSSDSSCSFSGRRGRPLRLSPLAILLAAIALPLRRLTRPRKTVSRSSCV